MARISPNGAEPGSRIASNRSHLNGGHATTNGINGTNGTNGTNGMNGTTGHHEITARIPELDGSEPIAIIGLGMRLPGRIHDSQAFWDLLINKKDARCRVPADRYNVDAFYGRGKFGHVGMEYGYFLDDVDLRDLDVSFFSMSKSEVEVLDPQQKQLLEVVHECLQNGGQVGYRGKNIGCFVGVFGEDWRDLDSKDSQNAGLYRITGYGDFVLANRVSYEFDFKGPSTTTRTACSSSLTALHDACAALRSGECTSAIVAGTNIILSPSMTIAMTEQGVLSPDASCKSFDADANGYARGEAISVIHVKTLNDALRDGDPIRAVIRSTSVNCDGKTAGLSYPSSESHEALIRRAYQVAGITDFSQTAFIECHGTGTPIGDPLEAKAIGNVFGKDGVYIGSVKPNLGHSEGASGITSIIKTVLALEHQIIPPNIKFTTPNPKIPFEKANLSVPVDAIPWPESEVERAGVNSFGIGGANAHVVLESARSMKIASAEASTNSLTNDLPRLLLFSANHTESLRRSIQGYQDYLVLHPQALDDLSYTLSARREHLTQRTFCITSGEEPLVFSPFSKAVAASQIVFVFTGQGAQWAQMGLELIASYPTFRDTIRELDGYLSGLPEPPKWTMEEEISKTKDLSRIHEAEFSQPACTAIQIALVNLLQSWDIAPAAVTGHSGGEIAAAYSCDAISAREAIITAFYRGHVTKSIAKVKPQRGSMAAVGLGRTEASSLLVPGVVIACENSPNSVTLSGDKDALDGVVDRLKSDRPDIFVRTLHVELAYHSYHMKEIQNEYEAIIEPWTENRRKALKIPFHSTVTGKTIVDSACISADYWRQNLVSPVLFNSAINSILQAYSKNIVFLEIGPHSALAGPLRQIFKASHTAHTYVPTLIRGQNAVTSLLNTAGQLFINSVPVNFQALTPGRKVLTDLPTYPWNYEGKYWYESRLSREWRLRKFPHHDILGSRVIESNDFEPSWRNMLRLDEVPWVRDHVIGSDIVFPGAGYVAMAGEAIRQLTGSADYTVRHVNFSQALVLHESKTTELMTHFHRIRLTDSLDSSWYGFSIFSQSGNTWIKHCSGEALSGCQKVQPSATTSSFSRDVTSSRWYKTMKKFGLYYGPRFQGLFGITADPNSNKAEAQMVDLVEERESIYALHPCTIDLAFQLFSVAAFKGCSRFFNKLSIPRYIEELYISPPTSAIRVLAESTATPRGTFHGDALGVSDDKTVFNLKGLKLSPLSDDNGNSRGDDPHAGVELVWRPDIEFLEPTTLVHSLKDVTDSHMLVERLALVCMIETSQSLASQDTSTGHLALFRDWVHAQKEKAANGTYLNVENSQGLVELSSNDRLELIDALYDKALLTEAASVATAVYRIFKSSTDIYNGSIDPLEVLLKHEILAKTYDFGQLWDCREFFTLLSHSKPNLKILEIGAGTGGTTALVLDYLVSPQGERMYFSYNYTDISAGFFVAAKERFKSYQGIEYSVLDISQDPLEQGFQEGSYDLIIASNVLHATPKLHDTLQHVRKLLNPSGHLFLQELCPQTRWINYVMVF